MQPCLHAGGRFCLVLPAQLQATRPAVLTPVPLTDEG